MNRDEAIKLLTGEQEGIRKWNQRRKADEEGPDLSGANLGGAIVGGAIVGDAIVGDAIVGDAIVGDAILREANLRGAILSGAELKNAVCGWTTFADVDLSVVTGLDFVHHDGPSLISVDTLTNSKGKIPETFLRGCGVPDALIIYLPSLIGAMSPIQFYSSFISYSAKDTPFAERLYADLQSNGVRCWYAPEGLKIGEKIRVGIDQSIRVHDKLLLVLSKNSVGSEWVEKEVETAMERERKEKRAVLFPIRLDDAVMKIEDGWPADIRRTRNIGDFRRWKNHDTYQKSFDRLMRDLQA
jgi:TIR domain/Pentapeptide repeats (8 copies)